VPSLAIIDDDHDAREALVDLFRHEGFQAFGVASPAQAIRLLASVKVDLLITDFKMPGMNGIALASAIRSQVPNGEALPIILLSGDPPSVAQDSRMVHVCKPPEPAALVALVSRLARRG
jgi:DNA-binding response OmpR family regulator